jgi:hypothetical protein
MRRAGRSARRVSEAEVSAHKDAWLPASPPLLCHRHFDAHVLVELLVPAHHGIVAPSCTLALATPISSSFMLRFGA